MYMQELLFGALILESLDPYSTANTNKQNTSMNSWLLTLLKTSYSFIPPFSRVFMCGKANSILYLYHALKRYFPKEHFKENTHGKNWWYLHFIEFLLEKQWDTVDPLLL